MYLVGPGSTTAGVMSALGLSGTLLGVDAVIDNELVGRDLTEAQILELLDRSDRGRQTQTDSPSRFQAVRLSNVMRLPNKEGIECSSNFL